MKVTIVTTMRNEGRHLLEWVAYHRAIGVTDFLIYTNDCDDGTDTLLDLLPYVTHIPLEAGEKPPQWRALKAAWDHDLVRAADWVACIDCDEFINLNSKIGDISHLVSMVNADAIILPWRLFGNNGEIDLGSKLTLETFTKAAPEHMLYPAIGSYFKTLFRVNGPFRQLGVHRPRQKKSERHPAAGWVDGSGHAIGKPLCENDNQIMNWGHPIANDLVQLNHYSVRSVSDFMIKRGRGLPNHQSKLIDLTYWVERNFNSVQDKSVSQRLDQLSEELINLKEVPGVLNLHNHACAWAEMRLAELLRRPEELALFGRLILAGASTPPTDERSIQLIQAYQVAHG